MSSVDVFVPSYNYGRFLKTCVESVLAQAAVQVRVLILDDCSSDDTAEVGQQLAAWSSRVTFRRHETNMGHIATFNEGLDWAEADYLLLLSADDYLLPDALARATALMDAHREIGFCYGNARELSPDETFCETLTGFADGAGQAAVIMTGMEFIRRICANKSRNIVPTPTAVIRTSLQKRVGGYRPELPHTADLEMWLRLAARGSVGFVPAYQAVYRRHDANMSLAYSGDRRIADLRQREAAIEIFVASCQEVLPDAPRLRAQMLENLAHESVSCARGAINDGDLERSNAYREFAVRLYPNVIYSFGWLRLLVKQLLPFRSALSTIPISSALAKMGSRIRRTT